jgi:hypothetical protein
MGHPDLVWVNSDHLSIKAEAACKSGSSTECTLRRAIGRRSSSLTAFQSRRSSSAMSLISHFYPHTQTGRAITIRDRSRRFAPAGMRDAGPGTEGLKHLHNVSRINYAVKQTVA